MLTEIGYKPLLDNETIPRSEFFYPHGQDKRTTHLNQILRKIVSSDMDKTTREKVTYSFNCEIPNVKYNFTISVPNRYNNSEILWEAVYHLVENVLVWYDLSEINNFEIKVDEGSFITKCTYYDLAFWGLNRSSVFGHKPNYSEDKYKRIIDWRNDKFNRERHEWEMMNAPKNYNTTEEPKRFKKLINKIKEYANISF